MHKLPLLAVALVGAALNAQSPLTTTFANNNGGSVGGGVYFDLTVNPAAGVNVRAIDVNLTSAAATAGTIEMHVRSGTHVGFEASTAGWTLLASGSVVAAGPGLPSRCVFPSPVNVPAGLNGVALRAVGVSHAYTNGNGTNQTYSNAELTLNAGSANNTAFGTAPFTPRVVNCTLYYGNEAFSNVTRSGQGCNSGAVSFYELWQAGAFDLSSGAARCTPNGNGGYNVTAVAPNIVAPAAAGLGLTDDSLSVQALGFTFNYQTGAAPGSTTDIAICSNGFIHLVSSATSVDFSPSEVEALTGGPRIFGLWCDLIPDGATNVANVFYDTVAGTEARVTWVNVPQFGGTGFTNMQIKIFATGIVEVHFGAAAGHTGSAMFGGYSPGAANLDPGNRDLSAAIPFSTQTDSAPLDQFASAPIINTTCNLQVSNITAGSIAGVELIGGLMPPLPLGGIGMPGCFLHIGPIALQLGFATGGSTATVPLGIPNSNALLGVQLSIQAATVSPGQNTLGVLSSNAATLTIGNL